jgi:hypothetical protein
MSGLKPTGTITSYDENSNNFAVSPALMLGHLYQQYQEELYLNATSRPSEYAVQRSNVIQEVKIKVVNDLYKNLRQVLCEGKLGSKQLVKLNGKDLCPNYPPVEADSRILSLCKAVDKEMDEIIDIIIPPFQEVLKNRLESKAV